MRRLDGSVGDRRLESEQREPTGRPRQSASVLFPDRPPFMAELYLPQAALPPNPYSPFGNPFGPGPFGAGPFGPGATITPAAATMGFGPSSQSSLRRGAKSSPERQSEAEDNSTRTDKDKKKRIPCAFFLKTGNCAFGSECKFEHPLDRPATRYNSLGLPLRPGEPDCAYYMRNMHCGYGPSCKFHHPEPMVGWVPVPMPEGVSMSPMMAYTHMGGSPMRLPIGSPMMGGAYMPAGMAPTMFQPMQQNPLQGLQPLMGPAPDFGAAQRGAAAAMSGGFMGQAPPSFYPSALGLKTAPESRSSGSLPSADARLVRQGSSSSGRDGPTRARRKTRNPRPMPVPGSGIGVGAGVADASVGSTDGALAQLDEPRVSEGTSAHPDEELLANDLASLSISKLAAMGSE